MSSDSIVLHMKLPASKITSKKALWASCKWPVSLFVFSLLMTIAFYVFLLLSSSSNNERSSKVYEQSLIASINQYEYLPALLSTDVLLIDTLINRELSYLAGSEKLEFIAQRSGADAIYIMNLDGDVVATSNFRTEQSFLYRNYSFRPYFTQA